MQEKQDDASSDAHIRAGHWAAPPTPIEIGEQTHKSKMTINLEDYKKVCTKYREKTDKCLGGMRNSSTELPSEQILQESKGSRKPSHRNTFIST